MEWDHVPGFYFQLDWILSLVDRQFCFISIDEMDKDVPVLIIDLDITPNKKRCRYICTEGFSRLIVGMTYLN